MNRLMLALALAALTAAATPAAAQRATPPVGFKDPGTATLIGVLVPGGGQIYAGETKKGLTLLGVGVGGLVVGTAMTVSSGDVDCDDDFDCDSDSSALPAILGYAVYLGSWVYGIIDADDSANRMNAQRGMAGVTPFVTRVGEGTGVGVSIRI
jgi:hypothetical protein